MYGCICIIYVTDILRRLMMSTTSQGQCCLIWNLVSLTQSWTHHMPISTILKMSTFPSMVVEPEITGAVATHRYYNRSVQTLFLLMALFFNNSLSPKWLPNSNIERSKHCIKNDNSQMLCVFNTTIWTEVWTMNRQVESSGNLNI